MGNNLSFSRTAVLMLVFLSISFCARTVGAQNFAPKNLQSINGPGWSFKENKGQLMDVEDAANSGKNNKPLNGIPFYGKQGGVNIYCKPGQISFVFTKPENDNKISEATGKPTISDINGTITSRFRTPPYGGGAGGGVLTVQHADLLLLGSNPNATITASDQQEYYEKYYTTGDANKGITNVRTYKTITYKNIYPNIDMVLHAGTDPAGFKNPPGLAGYGMEYSFIVRPGGNVADIQLQWNGLENIKQLQNGGIEYALPLVGASASVGVQNFETLPGNAPTFTQSAPISYQGSASSVGVQDFEPLPGTSNVSPINSKLITHNSTLSFQVSHYDHSRTLIIDPTLSWGTYYGGGSETATGITHDANNNIYITGSTLATTGIASSGAYQTSCGGEDVYLAKFTPSGALAWATYYGGSAIENSGGVTADNNNNIYIAGFTQSRTGIATSGAYQTYVDTINYSTFIAKFSATGSLVWGTYYGGMDSFSSVGYGGSSASAITHDANNNIIITGLTLNYAGIATAGAYQATIANDDGFIAKFTSGGSLSWGTYYGGEAYTSPSAICTDANNNIYITGETSDTGGIATTGTYQTFLSGHNTAFVAKFNSSGSKLLWGTYYGAASYNYNNLSQSEGITADANNNVYITGNTESTTGIATSGAYETSFNPGSLGSPTDIAFVAKFTSSGALSWGTYYGQDNETYPFGMATDGNNNIYITGRNSSDSGIATSGAYETGDPGNSDFAFMAMFSPAGSLSYGTYYGSSNTQGLGITADANNNIYFTGGTSAPFDIATSGAYQTSISGSNDAFLAKFGASAPSSSINTYTQDVALNYTSGSLITSPLGNANIALYLNGALIKSLKPGALGNLRFDTLATGTYKIIASVKTATGETIKAVFDNLNVGADVTISLPSTLRAQLHSVIDSLGNHRFNDGFLYPIMPSPVNAAGYDESKINTLLTAWDTNYNDVQIPTLASLVLAQHALNECAKDAAAVIGKAATTAYGLGNNIVSLIALKFKKPQTVYQQPADILTLNLLNRAIESYVDNIHWDMELSTAVIPDDFIRSQYKTKLDGAFGLLKQFAISDTAGAIPQATLQTIIQGALANFATTSLFTNTYIPYTSPYIDTAYTLSSGTGGSGNFNSQFSNVNAIIRAGHKTTTADSVEIDTLINISNINGYNSIVATVVAGIEGNTSTQAGIFASIALDSLAATARKVSAAATAVALEISGNRLYEIKNELSPATNQAFFKKSQGQPYSQPYIDGIQGSLASNIISYDSILTLINTNLSKGPAVLGPYVNALMNADSVLMLSVNNAAAPVYGAAPTAPKYVAGFDSLYNRQLIGAFSTQYSIRQAYFIYLAAFLIDSSNFYAQDSVSKLSAYVVAGNDTLQKTIARFINMIKTVPVNAFVMVTNVAQPQTITMNSKFNLTVDFTNFGSLAATGLYAKIVTTGGFKTTIDSIYIGSLAQSAASNIAFSINAPAKDTFGNFYVIFYSPNTASDGIGGAIMTGTLTNGIFTPHKANTLKLVVAPNPFTNTLSISYNLLQNQVVNLTLTDITGKQIASLANENQSPGSHIYTLDAEKYHIPAGIYFLRMVAGNDAVEQKIVRLR